MKFGWAEKQTDGQLTVSRAHTTGVCGVTDTLPKGHGGDFPHQVKGQGLSHSVVLAVLDEGIHAALFNKLAL